MTSGSSFCAWPKLIQSRNPRHDRNVSREMRMEEYDDFIFEGYSNLKIKVAGIRRQVSG
jgi:hypothetical protein